MNKEIRKQLIKGYVNGILEMFQLNDTLYKFNIDIANYENSLFTTAEEIIEMWYGENFIDSLYDLIDNQVVKFWNTEDGDIEITNVEDLIDFYEK